MSPSWGTCGIHQGKTELPSACPFADFKKEDETRLHFNVSIYYVGKIQFATDQRFFLFIWTV